MSMVRPARRNPDELLNSRSARYVWASSGANGAHGGFAGSCSRRQAEASVPDSVVEIWLATISIVMACLRTDRSNADLLAVVGDLARRFSAAVVGVVARQASMHSAIMAIGPGEPPDRDLEKFREGAAAVEAEFRSALSNVVDLQWRSQMTASPPSEHVAADARGVDLIVAPAESGDSIFPHSPEIDVSDLLMRAGRPVVIAPAGSAGLKLTRALVCWKESREARRAVVDALPILKACKRVDVVELVDGRDIEPARSRLADLGDWFARHAVEANCLASPLEGTEAAHLATIARDLDIELIVAGAFGRSRLREWAFGGVTRDLLLRADRCTLVSH
jgi:nucleotide-binding universal stress UspA family protein